MLSRRSVWIAPATICLTIAWVLAAEAPAKPEKPRRQPRTKKTAPKMKPTRMLVYKTTTNTKGAEIKLNLHVFEPAGLKATDGRSAIVFFFGGGWNGGTPGQFYPHCKYLASRGMVAFSAEYRVKGKHGTSPFECVADGKSAVRYIRANAAKLGVDPNRIAVGGGSAGGHVAAATGTVPGLDDPADDMKISALPCAMVLFNPVYDNSSKGYGHSRVKGRWREISPMHNITKNTPPTIVFLGDKDGLIPVATAEDFKARMARCGVRNDLHVYKGQGHGFFNFGRNGDVCYAKTVHAADLFLASLKMLNGPPTIKLPDEAATKAE